VWVVAGVGLLAALGLLIAARPISALIAACSGILSLAVGLLQKIYGGDRHVQATGGRRFGRAPYAHTDCPSKTEFVKKLDGMLAELRNGRERESWAVEWSPFDEHCQKAATAAEAGDDDQALQEYALALRKTMQQLRSRGGDKASDSVIDY
jgi:hypothetical protein